MNIIAKHAPEHAQSFNAVYNLGDMVIVEYPDGSHRKDKIRWGAAWLCVTPVTCTLEEMGDCNIDWIIKKG